MLLTCTKCKQSKTPGEFHIKKKSRTGRMTYCKVCALAYGKAKRASSPNGRREEHREYHQKNSESIARRKKVYNAITLAERTSTVRKWRQANRSKVRARRAKYRAQLLKATPSWADALVIQSFYDAAVRLSIQTNNEYEVDHIVPLNSKLVCGLYCEANLQVILGKENRQKSNLFWPDKWG